MHDQGIDGFANYRTFECRVMGFALGLGYELCHYRADAGPLT